jgi:hypothetical protein
LTDGRNQACRADGVVLFVSAGADADVDLDIGLGKARS